VLFPALVAVLAVVAVVAVVAGTRHGVGATPDSATYASVAENLSQGRGLTTYDGSELTLFPPGLSATLAVGRPLGLDPPQMARILNVLSLVAIVVLSAVLLRRSMAHGWLQMVGVALVAVSPVLLFVSVMLWSEASFVAVTLGFLLVLGRALEDRRSHALVVGSAVLAGAGFLLRYPGLVLVGFGIAALAVQALRHRSRDDLARLGLYTVVALLPVSLWLGHNLSHGALLTTTSGNALEDRTQAGLGFGANVSQALETIGSWLAPSGSLVVLAIIAAVGMAIMWMRRQDGEGADTAVFVPVLGLFSLAYVGFVLLGASATKVDALNDRLLSPVYVPLLVLLLVGFERVLTLLGGDRRLLAWALVGVLAVWSVYPVSTWLARVEEASAGVGFVSAQWKGSATIALLQDLPEQDPLYSNWPDGTYYAGGIQPVGFGPTDSATSVADFTRAVDCAGVVRLAQFVYDRPLLVHPDELGPGVRVVVIGEAADGTIYRVSAAGETEGDDCSA
jgi:hypothetical protein